MFLYYASILIGQMIWFCRIVLLFIGLCRQHARSSNNQVEHYNNFEDSLNREYYLIAVICIMNIVAVEKYRLIMLHRHSAYNKNGLTEKVDK